MAINIDSAFINQFSANLHMMLEQGGSKCMQYADVEMIRGEKAFFDRLGDLTVQERVSRNEETPLQDADHTRRMILLKDYHGGVPLEHTDQLRMMIDPTSAYAKRLSDAMGRKIDDVIISALIGTAATGKDGSGSESFDTTNNQIAASATGFTFAKLLQARRMLANFEYMDGPLYCLIPPTGLEDLLDESKLTSSDYQVAKALVRGDIDTVMGVKFIQTTRVPLSGSDKQAIIFGESAVKFAMAEGLTVRVDERPDLSYALQVYVRSSFGAVRMEQNRVISVLYA